MSLFGGYLYLFDGIIRSYVVDLEMISASEIVSRFIGFEDYLSLWRNAIQSHLLTAIDGSWPRLFFYWFQRLLKVPRLVACVWLFEDIELFICDRPFGWSFIYWIIRAFILRFVLQSTKIKLKISFTLLLLEIFKICSLSNFINNLLESIRLFDDQK